MAALLMTQGPLEGTFFRLPDEPVVSVGRDDQCTLQLLDRSISRQHLQIRFDPATGARSAMDYRSANGVVVNGIRIADAVRLVDGDTLTLGETTMVYLEADHPDATTAMDAVRKSREWKRSTLMRDE
ncbi:MAG: FHA domain-containing protein [Planctomycetota bacterium]